MRTLIQFVEDSDMPSSAWRIRIHYQVISQGFFTRCSHLPLMTDSTYTWTKSSVQSKTGLSQHLHTKAYYPRLSSTTAISNAPDSGILLNLQTNLQDHRNSYHETTEVPLVWRWESHSSNMPQIQIEAYYQVITFFNGSPNQPRPFTLPENHWRIHMQILR